MQKFGSAKDYYFAEMSLYTVFGVLAADFHPSPNPLSSKNSLDFTKRIVEPAVREVENIFGVKPKIFKFSYQAGDEFYPKL